MTYFENANLKIDVQNLFHTKSKSVVNRQFMSTFKQLRHNIDMNTEAVFKYQTFFSTHSLTDIICTNTKIVNSSCSQLQQIYANFLTNISFEVSQSN